jgi:hypothetical protein
MWIQEHEAAVRRWIKAWNAHDLDAVQELLAPDFVRHDANLPDVVGPAAERDFILGVFGAFPDISSNRNSSPPKATSWSPHEPGIGLRTTHRPERRNAEACSSARSRAINRFCRHTQPHDRPKWTLRLLRDCPDEKQPPDLKTPHRHRPYGLNPSIQTRPGRRGPYTTSWAHEVALTLG